jgi:hypothetical protein
MAIDNILGFSRLHEKRLGVTFHLTEVCRAGEVPRTRSQLIRLVHDRVVAEMP